MLSTHHVFLINTHSPVVVQQVPEDSLVVAELKETVQAGKRFKRVSFGCLPGTWRSHRPSESGHPVPILAKGQLLAYLNPVPHQLAADTPPQKKRVVDREDLTPMIPGLVL